MNNAKLQVPAPENEPVLSYAPGSPERALLRAKLDELKGKTIQVPVIAGDREITTGKSEAIRPPHEKNHVLGHYHKSGGEEVAASIEAARAAQYDWQRMPWFDRAAIFLKAAELLAGPWRATLNAATMLGQSKSPHQAEIDAACELIDFLRFNAYYMQQVYEDQPASSRGVWNRMQYRALEGFVFAVTPFNFTAIAGNLPTAPAMMGNTVLWKPASTAVYSGYFICRLLEEAGLPPGVINFLPGDGPDIGDPVFASPYFAGLHFTGSTGTFQHMWRTIGGKIAHYRGYPRIVGETGGKDFLIAHASADPRAVATAIVRGGYEYQGQKCSALSRVYIPRSTWPAVQETLLDQLSAVRMGPVEDFGNFMNAVIDEKSYRKIVSYIDAAAADQAVQVLYGGRYRDDDGWFIEPTLLQADNPFYRTMCEEIFGPVVTLHLYDEKRYEETLGLVDSTSPYALTGAVFARDRRAILQATEALTHAAGNFYINDKPTGAVVGQQPFGGARASGTNDKAGSYLNLIRWVSARTIKETFDPPVDFEYPFMASR